MLFFASGGSVPSKVFAPARGPSEAVDGLRMVARHIGVIGARDRFRPTAAAGTCSTGVYGGREKYCGKNLQQGFLVICWTERAPSRLVAATFFRRTLRACGTPEATNQRPP